MKPVVESLRLGQKVWATIEEVRSEGDLLVNFEGDLLRISNRAGRRFRPGQRVQLHVELVSPLQFRLVEPKRIQLGIDIEA